MSEIKRENFDNQIGFSEKTYIDLCENNKNLDLIYGKSYR